MPKKEIHVHSSIEDYSRDGDPDYLYLPPRALAMAGQDGIVVLPEAPSVQRFTAQFASVAQAHLGLDFPRTVFIPGDKYLLDEAISDTIPLMENSLRRTEQYRVLPYANTRFLRDWVGQMNTAGFNLEIGLPEKVYEDRHPQHRGGWGRWVDDPGKPSFPQKYGLPYPDSFVGQGLDQVREAYELLQQRTGQPEAFFKPVYSAGGFTLKEFSSVQELEDHYRFLESRGALEINGRVGPVEVQQKIVGIRNLVSLQYDGDRVVTPGLFSQQTVEGSNWVGNIFNTPQSPEVLSRVSQIFTNFSRGMSLETGGNFYGWGGLDMAIVDRDGREDVVIIEHNGGRITGAHPPSRFAQRLDVADQPFLLRKVSSPHGEFSDVWDLLRSHDLALDGHRTGSVPMLWLDGAGFIFTTAPTQAELAVQIDSTLDICVAQGFLGI